MSFPIPDFEAMAAQLLNNLAPEIAKEAQAFFKGSFDKEGFTDYGFIAWPKRKDAETHKILTKSQTLRNSVVIKSQTPQRIEIMAGEGLPYAEIHNKGGTINVTLTPKARKFFWYMYKKTEDEKWKRMAITKKQMLNIRIPQRQYIGESQELNKLIDRIIRERLKEAQRSLTHNS